MSYLVENNVLQGTASPGTSIIANDIYETHGVFSINSSNQLRGSLWLSKNGQAITSSLGLASYTVYDADGSSVGLTESSIAADANGVFEITPVSASALIDLTHYVVKITISYESQNRIAFKGITLGE